MPLESILFLSLVVGALTLFAVVLAYADWSTSKVTRVADAAARPSKNPVKKSSAHFPPREHAHQ